MLLRTNVLKEREIDWELEKFAQWSFIKYYYVEHIADTVPGKV